MRRLKTLARDERGANAVLIVFLMVPMMGFGALALDVGAQHAEHTQLQHGADAGALAIAASCANDETTCVGAAEGLGNDYIASNGGTPVSGSAEIEALNLTSNNVTLAAAADFPHFLEGLIDGDDDPNSTTVRSRATAEWGTPVFGSVLPYAIGTCEFNTGRLTSGQEVVIENTNRTTCPGTGSPGGFGWLNSPTGCEVELGLGERIEGDTGSWGSNSGCDLSTVELCSTVLVPVYDRISRNADGTGIPSGTNAYYHIEKFAAFVLNGWKKDGSHHGQCAGVAPLFNTANPAGGRWPNSGIQGHFVRFVSIDEEFELGSGPDTGLTVVRLKG
jgi:Flp pilus assembly protein TadG